MVKFIVVHNASLLATYEDDLQESAHLCAAIADEKRLFIIIWGEAAEHEYVGSYQYNCPLLSELDNSLKIAFQSN